MPKRNSTREEKDIDQMEKDAAIQDDSGDEVEVKAPPPTGKEEPDDPWAGEERKDDEYSKGDKEATVKLYTLSIGDEPVLNGKPNPAFRKLCLVKDMSIEPRELIRCAVLERIRPRIAQIDYQESKKLPKDEPWLKYLGYSFNGNHPSPDSQGNVFSLCINKDKGKPYYRCSMRSKWDEAGNVEEVPLLDDSGKIQEGNEKPINAHGECPWGRWGNSLTDEDRKLYGISVDDTPMCNENLLLYCWDLDLLAPFVVYFKVSSIKAGEAFVSSCERGIGDKKKKYPFYAFEAHLTVLDKGRFAIPHIINTGKFILPKDIKPVVKWFENNRHLLVRNLSLSMEESKKRKEEQMSMPTDDNVPY